MYQILSRVYYRRGEGFYEGRKSCRDARNRMSDKTSLSFTESRIKDLTPLASLVEFKKLKALYLDNNGIRNLTGISKLTQIRKLRLDENYITDISLLSNLVNLEELDLSENPVEDFTPFSNLVKLRSLNLSYAHIVNVRPLVDAIKNISTLESLYLSANDIVDVTPLDELAVSNLILDKASMCQNVVKSTPRWIRELCREYVCDGIEELTDEEVKKWKKEFCASEPVAPEDMMFD